MEKRKREEIYDLEIGGVARVRVRFVNNIRNGKSKPMK